MTPPRIMAVPLREKPERIDEPRIHHILKSLALLVGESLFPAVRLGICEIEFGVGDVQIAAKNNRLARLELPAISQKCRIPMLEAQIQPAEVVLGVRRIHGDHVIVFEFSRDDPALIGAVASQLVRETEARSKLRRITVDDGDRLLLGKNGRSRIALFGRRVPVLAVARQIDFNLPAFSLGLLETQDIGLMFLEERQEQPLAMDRANAVHIPGVELHDGLPSITLTMVDVGTTTVHIALLSAERLTHGCYPLRRPARRRWSADGLLKN